MKHLRLGAKIAILNAIMIATVVGITWTAIDRMGAARARVQQIAEVTLKKLTLAADLRATMLSCNRAQKNTVLSSDENVSVEFAELA